MGVWVTMKTLFIIIKLRCTLEGFWEERFHSFLRAGEMAQVLGHPWEDCMKWFMKAIEHSSRAEPFIKIAEYYKDKNWFLCFTFIEAACKLNYPNHCILFVDKHSYDYTRWHLLGICRMVC